MRTIVIAALAALALLCPAHAAGKKPVDCARFHLDTNANQPFQAIVLPPDHLCTPGESRGFPIPDPSCSPGAINPTVTIEILRDPKFRTSCLRDGATSAAAKSKTYAWYRIAKPKNNAGRKQQCELDHIVSLELGGSDSLGNIWPQCGPSGVKLNARYFKIKDKVENYLAKAVREGTISLRDAQRGVAEDWPQYIEAANGKTK